MKHFTSISGSLLATFLLLISCATAKCDASCDLLTMRPAAHKTSAGAKSTMHDCGMETMAAANVAVFATHAACAHAVCTHDPFVTQAEETLPLPVVPVRTFVVATSTDFPLRHAASASAPHSSEETPPLRNITPLALASILRV
jgi:hypothetical protein